jgi:hypothetical protein
MPRSLSDIEEEVILLKAIDELIDSMVNFEMLSLKGTDPDSSILFESMTHQRFFNIVLVDFLSRTDRKGPIKRTSYLGGLRYISKNPSFNVNNSVALLREATDQFANWLEQEFEVDVWLPSIDTQTKVKLSRLIFIKICGDISKHNFLRSMGPAEDLREILANSGVSITLDDALPALADFYQWFHTDILNYHSSAIAEFLNNIRWGIYEYLQPEFKQSIVWERPPMYRFTYPLGLASKLAKQCYWELMNEIRSPPYVRRFVVTEWLKLRY